MTIRFFYHYPETNGIDERNALFDEALEVMPRHWSGEPFSYHARHFDARDIIARPRPVQNPIPIWIGGNSKLSRRRVAERAQGWMPMGGPGGRTQLAGLGLSPSRAARHIVSASNSCY